MRRFLGGVLTWWGAGFLVILIINSVMTLGLGLLLATRHGDKGFDVAYRWTVVPQLIVNLVVWTWAARRVFRAQDASKRTIAGVAATWVAASILADAILHVWLLAGTPAGAPPETFYVDNQPWTTLYYVAVLCGVLLGASAARRPASRFRHRP